MMIRQLLSLLQLFSVTNMNLTSPKKQRHIKKALESHAAESVVFASLLHNKRVKQGHSPITPVTHPTWSELIDDLTNDEFHHIFWMQREMF
jgi:hypothetical protein